MSKAVKKSTSKQNRAFRKFVAQFGTHFVEATQLGAKVYYERRFTRKSKSEGTMNARRDCVGKAAEGCTGGNFAIFFISVKAQKCPSKSTEKCTVSKDN